MWTLDHLAEKKELSLNYYTPNDFKNNLKLRIQCSKAMQIKEHFKVSEIIEKIENDKKSFIES
jgi:predicted ATP-grasp superfamily ATP-dependent carboligase